jgi:hypothetical protein
MKIEDINPDTLAILRKALGDYQVVLEPDENRAEWWAGAPSVCRSSEGGFFLAARMREGLSPKGKRGYEVRLLESEDGAAFSPILSLTREAVDVPGFERPALVHDPVSGLYRLYLCAGLDSGWTILKLDDVEHPSQFDAATIRPVLSPTDTAKALPNLEGYKDPFLTLINGVWHMFIIGFDRVERPYHFVSDDGDNWELVTAAALVENTNWHNYYVRPACLLPVEKGFWLVYEGSHTTWHDAVYNIATGLAYTPDLEQFVNLTPAEPLLMSTTPGPYHTWRYSHWLPVDDTVHVYFEAARPNGTNETRLAVIEPSLLPPCPE